MMLWATTYASIIIAGLHLVGHSLWSVKPHIGRTHVNVFFSAIIACPAAPHHASILYNSSARMKILEGWGQPPGCTQAYSEANLQIANDVISSQD